MVSNQDKAWWCKHGEELERVFLDRRFDRVKIKRNPDKDGDPFTYDMVMQGPCDLKTITTPWRKSMEFWGIDPRNAVSINRKDLRRYAKLYPEIMIVFDVRYPEHRTVRYAGLWMMQRLLREGKLHLHEYLARMGSSDGNAKESYVFDVTLLPELHEVGDGETK